MACSIEYALILHAHRYRKQYPSYLVDATFLPGYRKRYLSHLVNATFLLGIENNTQHSRGCFPSAFLGIENDTRHTW